MTRQHLFNEIEWALSTLVTSIRVRGGLNILDKHVHSENFYALFLNLLFGWQLQNLNAIKQNAAAIDLVDTNRKIIIQVSSTCTKQKIQSALKKNLAAYSGYSFKFISISEDASLLRGQKFENPHCLNFNPKEDIYDVKTILNFINSLSEPEIAAANEFVKREIKSIASTEPMASNITLVIDILSKEDLSPTNSVGSTPAFEIQQKIDVNKIEKAAAIIEDFKIHGGRVDKIYCDCDKAGFNKSTSVLNGIRQMFLRLDSKLSPDEKFFKTIDAVCERVQQSKNYVEMPLEELGTCAGILVVDAFIRCKIFENPVKIKDAHS